MRAAAALVALSLVLCGCGSVGIGLAGAALGAVAASENLAGDIIQHEDAKPPVDDGAT